MRYPTVLLLALAVVAPAALAAPPLANRLPADAIAYIGWAGRNHAFDGSELGQMLDKTRLGQGLEVVKAVMMRQDGDESEHRIRVHLLNMLAVALRHEMALCVVPLRADANTGSIPGIAAVVELGGDRAEFDTHLQALIGELEDHTELADATLGPVSFVTIPAGPSQPMFSAGYIDRMAFVAVGAEMPAKLIALREAADRSLLNAASFAAAYKDVTGDNEQVAMYLDLPKMLGSLDGLAPAWASRLRRQMDLAGLGNATTYVSSVCVVDRGMKRKTRLSTPAPHQGLAGLLAGPSLQADDLAAVPADAGITLAWRIAPGDAYRELLRSLTRANKGASAAVETQLAAINTALGVDVLACLGERGVVAYAPSLGGLVTGVAVVVDLAEPARLAEALDGLYAAYGRPPEAGVQPDRPPRLRRTRAGQTTITYLMAPATAGGGFSPAWAIHNDKLIVAAWPQVVAAVIDMAGQPGLSTDRTFEQGWGRLDDLPSVFGHVNAPALLRHGYGLALAGWMGAARRADEAGAWWQAPWLPSLPVMERRVRPTLGGFYADDEGLGAESFGTLPALGADPLLACLAGAEFLDRLAARAGTNRADNNVARLRRIGQALAAYQQQHGRRPADLQTLADEGLVDPELVRPAIGDVYIPLPVDAEAHLILVYVPPADETDSTAVLFADHSAATMAVDKRFRDLVEMSETAADQ